MYFKLVNITSHVVYAVRYFIKEKLSQLINLNRLTCNFTFLNLEKDNVWKTEWAPTFIIYRQKLHTSHRRWYAVCMFIFFHNSNTEKRCKDREPVEYSTIYSNSNHRQIIYETKLIKYGTILIY